MQFFSQLILPSFYELDWSEIQVFPFPNNISILEAYKNKYFRENTILWQLAFVSVYSEAFKIVLCCLPTPLAWGRVLLLVCFALFSLKFQLQMHFFFEDVHWYSLCHSQRFLLLGWDSYTKVMECASEFLKQSLKTYLNSLSNKRLFGFKSF